MAAPARLQQQRHQQPPRGWLLLAAAGCLLLALATLPGASAQQQPDFLNAPSVSECRVHIEAALKQVGQQEPINEEEVRQGDEADVESISNEGIIESAEATSDKDDGGSEDNTKEDEGSQDNTTEEQTGEGSLETATEETTTSTEEQTDASIENTAEDTASVEDTAEDNTESVEELAASDASVEETGSVEEAASAEDAGSVDGAASVEEAGSVEEAESFDEGASVEEGASLEEGASIEESEATSAEAQSETLQDEAASSEDVGSLEDLTKEDVSLEGEESQEPASLEHQSGETAETTENTDEVTQSTEAVSTEDSVTSVEDTATEEAAASTEDTATEEAVASTEDTAESVEDQGTQSVEDTESTGESTEDAPQASAEDGTTSESIEATDASADEGSEVQASTETTESIEAEAPGEAVSEESEQQASSEEPATQESISEETQDAAGESKETVESEEGDSEQVKSRQRRELGDEQSTESEKTAASEKSEEEAASTEVATETETSNVTETRTVAEELAPEITIPTDLRPKDHVSKILRLDADSIEPELLLAKTVDSTLRELKRLYDTAIKPLEMLYKYRDLSNRHFGDPEIFSKPLILFMGPWSGGKSTIINYLMDIEYTNTALRTGAEPSPAYFNILMHGDREEVLDGTQLAADWTFSGLQKFGQGLLDRLRGLRLNNRLLEKVNIVEIPGILEIRKQVERVFPFNDACQWFIDRADVIFLVYDPSKLDVGPETEAILDQLKGREYQTRIILNKADQVRPEELMRVQGTLIWNISPLMSSSEPPVMYSTSLWAVPYEPGAPTRLLYAQEVAFLRDIRDAINKRVENKIASARRFAVRVRNHAKMVDCYLTTYYNHKTLFGNKQKISDDIIEHPQNYHIYEGLSTLTNISRYDLPDPEVYRDFFKLNPLYEFQQLSATCTYFRGCPINRLDVAIAYDLPELVGKYKKAAEEVLSSVAMKS